LKGKVIKTTGSWHWVETEEGRVIKCRARGRLRIQGLSTTNPAVIGDIVEIKPGREPGEGTIQWILPRENYLVRESPKNRFQRHVLAANIDQAFLLVTLVQPDLKPGFADRFLTTCELFHIPAKIIVNKSDLFTEKSLEKLDHFRAVYEPLGYPVYSVSAKTGEGFEPIKQLLHEKTTLLSGHSGTGKSTIINRLIPDLNLKVQELSRYTGKGKHTTTFSQMYRLPEGGYIIDTPGIKEWKLIDVRPEELSHYFPEMRSRLSGCRFNDCLHINEPGCAVLAALDAGEISPDRYDRYILLLEELREKKYWEID